MGLLSMPLLLVVAIVAGTVFAERFPMALGATIGVVLSSLFLAVVLLRRGVALKTVAALLVGADLAAVGTMSLANGGLSFTVAIWALPIPLAVPVMGEWRRFFAATIAATVALLVGLFVIDLVFDPPSLLRGSARASVLACAATWLALFVVFRHVSRTSGAVTDDHGDERDRYQRALLQSQKLSSLGHLAEDLVRNFSDVLRSMRATVSTLRSAVSGGESPEEIDELEGALERAEGLSERLARYGVGESEVLPQLTVDAAVSNLERVGRRIASRGVETRFELASHSAKVNIAPGHLDQILVNLMVNANDALDGEGTITVRTRRDGEHVVIEVADDGPGIPDDVLPLIFKPFFTTKPAGVGSGLGLWSARSTAREVGGDLEIASSAGGTVVSVRLPLATGMPTPARGVATVSRFATHGSQSDHERLLERFRWFVEGVREPREQTFGAVLVSLCLVGGLLWGGFALWYWLGFRAPAVARTLAIAGVLTLAVPLLLRLTGSNLACLSVLGLVLLGGLTNVALARGGFPIEVLIWFLVIPLFGNLLVEYKRFTVVFTTVCLLYVGTLLVVTLGGFAPQPTVLLTAVESSSETLAILLGALVLFATAARSGQAVDHRLVAERDEFRGALRQSQRLETLGTFASSIAHDLNNVLMVLQMNTESLAASVAERDARFEIRALDASCERIRSLAQQLVRFGRRDDDDDETAVDEALLDLESMIAPLLSDNITLERRLEAPNARVELAPKLLDQLLINLILNARDAMPSGGKLTIRTRQDSGTIIIDVSDTGAGIPDSIASQVFSPFFSTRESHMGLGLWLCRSVANDCGGSLEIARTSATGTRMRLTLPLAGVSWNRRISQRIAAITIPRRANRITQ